MTREEAMRSFFSTCSISGSRIGHKSTRTPIDHAVLPGLEEAACGVKVIAVNAEGGSAFDPNAPFACTNCKRTLKQFPPPVDAIATGIAANKRRSENTRRANALIEAVGAMFRRHDARARACNFDSCGCEDCLALHDAAEATP